MTGYPRPDKQLATDKFMQSVASKTKRELDEIALERGITIQELIRAVIIPEWLKYLQNIDIRIESTIIPRARKLPFEGFRSSASSEPVAAAVADQH